MRTTLDIDERVLVAARAKADADGTSIGTALSAIALRALERPAGAGGFPTFSPTPDHVITDELVLRHRDES